MDWMHQYQELGQLQAVMNVIVNIQVLLNVGNFLTNQGTSQ